ncbi:MAG: ArsR family transcriptional regulator, partial [Mesorhizobium sp.]
QITEWFSDAGLDLGDSQEFEPRGGNEASLTVKLWLGRDQRMLIADPSNHAQPANAYPIGETA